MKKKPSFDIEGLVVGGQIDRRKFLQLGAGAAALAAMGCTTDSGDTLELGRFPVGSIEDFEEGAPQLFDEGPFFVVRDAQGVFAMTAICTHQACTVEVGQDELPCPCHGSRFDLEGNVLEGPAEDPLDHLQVELGEDGELVVDTSIIVDPSERILPV